MLVADNTAQPPALKVLGSGEAYQDEGINGVNLLQAQNRYGEERTKRLREDMNDQFIDISTSDQFERFREDPWVDESLTKDAKVMFPDGFSKVLILGAGLGGIIYAVRLIDQGGLLPADIRIIDSAGGFGGTWYWNRYPGLACDIESYCYLPLLEETGYIPKHRYSFGEEIRLYANAIAQKWGFAERAVFQTKATKLEWDENAKEWMVELEHQLKRERAEKLNIRSQFVVTSNGVLNHPKLPKIPGIMDYGGQIFHSSRWDYDVTGGSPTDPSLTKLSDKTVAVIGTGASSVQIVSEVAKWAKQLYVVQRTPAAVDHRDQRETDQEWFRKKVATGKGWQRERMKNFHAHFTTKEKPLVNLVSDQWTSAEGMVAVSGNPYGPKNMEEVPAYMRELHTTDLPRQNRIRARVNEVVQNKEWARALQPWYPTWCKRPCFHDEYLPAFNRSNVQLVDTEGKGLSAFTQTAIVVAGSTIDVDMAIFATGFRAPFLGCPADKANLTIKGRTGIDMSSQWMFQGPSTLHGLLDANFPNLFLSGPWQASLSGNNLFNIDNMAREAAYILREATKLAEEKMFSVRPTEEAAEDWGNQILARAAPMAALAGCTPGYFNVEGLLDVLPPDAQVIAAKSGLWGSGVEDYTTTIESWMEGGGMTDIEVSVADV